jgi:hypothetical protein
VGGIRSDGEHVDGAGQRAGAVGTSQANVWRIEHEEDIYLSTLRRYVDALGGRLEIAAVFPDETIRLMPAESKHEEESPVGRQG